MRGQLPKWTSNLRWWTSVPEDTDTSTLASANTPVSSENVKTAVCGVVEELDPCQRGSLNRP
jgi:hypothetical protein